MKTKYNLTYSVHAAFSHNSVWKTMDFGPVTNWSHLGKIVKHQFSSGFSCFRKFRYKKFKLFVVFPENLKYTEIYNFVVFILSDQ